MPITKTGINLLLAHHGLDADNNTDQDVANSIAQAMTEDEASDLENRARAGDQARHELVDADLARYANRIGQSGAAQSYWKEALLKNRASARAALEALPEAARRQPLYNRASAGTPQSLDQASLDPQSTARERAVKIRNRATALLHENPKLKFAHAWKQAETEVPNSNPKQS
jgi:hypothetical protein